MKKKTSSDYKYVFFFIIFNRFHTQFPEILSKISKPSIEIKKK